MKNFPKDKYEKMARAFLQYYIDCGFSIEDFKSDYRAGSVTGYQSIVADSGGLYTTSPENKSQYIRVRQLVGKKIYGKFKIDDLVR